MMYRHAPNRHASGAQPMTYERSYTVCIKTALGRGGLLQALDMITLYWIFLTREHAFIGE
jgi:hypothetical protein